MSKHTESKPIPGCPGYEVTKNGCVFSVDYNWRGYGKRRMAVQQDRQGYLRVRLTVNNKRKKYRVHQLVVRTFLGMPPTNTHEIRHLDGNPTNNNISNLVWGTCKQNATDRDKHGNTYHPIGSMNATAKLTEDKVIRIRRMLSEGLSQRKIADIFGVSQSAIAFIARGVTWTHV